MIYVVKKGDTLEKISGQTGVPVWKIILDNQPGQGDKIVPGQALLISVPGEQKDAAGALSAGGYAYPFIEPAVLETALAVIRELLVFSYGFTFEGALVPPQDAHWMTESARKCGVRPLMVLTPFSEGAFNNQLVKVLVENKEIQDRLIGEIQTVIEKEGYAGVNVDFEYILPENKFRYTQFLGRLKEEMNRSGHLVSAAVAPKVSDTQKGLLVEGLDYRAVGENTDAVFLMTYEWGYAYGPPMAVAPLDKVRQVVEYALEKIPAHKLILGIPNYGYDWTLPYERGITRARTVGNEEAVRLAVNHGAVIQYAKIAQSPWFVYRESGMEHVVWFEDIRSMQAKWELAEEYGLSGVWYWNLMKPFAANWRGLKR